jgi:energy-coupling factor transport system permease protein
MQDFAFLRHLTIGQYLPGDSFVHRLDPRTKITLALLLVIALTVNTSYLANIILFGLCLGLIAAAGLSPSYILGGVRPAVPVLIFLAVFQLLFMGSTPLLSAIPRVVFWEWGPFSISTIGVQVVVVSLLRFASLTILVSLLTNTTPMAYLTYGIEDMLRPFARLGVPAHEIALVGTITLRFVPILAEQMETIMKAQASRGADIAAGGRLGFLRTARGMLAFVVPLFLDAFRRAEDLIVAMEARCYTGGRNRTRLVQLHLGPADGVVLAAATLISVAMVVFRTRFPF